MEFSLDHLLHIDVTEDLKDNAETIRAYLSAARDGAIFLSAADAALLVQWLESGLPPAAIMTAIDRVAKRRQAKISRRRFTLKACQGELNKLLKINEKKPETKSEHGLHGLISQIRSMEIPTQLRPAKMSLINDLKSIASSGKKREEMATTAINSTRLFQDHAWEKAQNNAEDLLIAAETELEPLKEMLGIPLYREALTEHMRNAVRSRYPLCTAQAVWTAMNTVEERE